MIRDIKNCLRLIKYGSKVKQNVVCGCLFLLLGVSLILVNTSLMMLGVVYVNLGLFYGTQVMEGLLFTGLVASSPKRKKLAIRTLDWMTAGCAVVSALTVLLVTYLGRYFSPHASEMQQYWEMLLVINGFLIAMILNFRSVGYKYFAVSMCMVFVASICAFVMESSRILQPIFGGHMLMSIIVYFGEVVMGYIISVIIRRKLYKKPYSDIETKDIFK